MRGMFQMDFATSPAVPAGRVEAADRDELYRQYQDSLKGLGIVRGVIVAFALEIAVVALAVGFINICR